MFTEALSGNTKTILATLGKSNLLKDAYLAGGTACALQLGHRLSFDLDFFTPKEFNTLNIIDELEKTIDFQLARLKGIFVHSIGVNDIDGEGLLKKNIEYQNYLVHQLKEENLKNNH